MLEFKLPELGENITGGTAVKINVKAGDQVKKDQPLVEIETDKATIEVPSPADGVIKEILIKENSQIKVGQTLMKIEAGAAAKAEAPSKPEAKPAAKETPKPPTKPEAPAKTKPAESEHPDRVKPPIATPDAQIIPQMTVAPAAKEVPAPPSVRKFAREIGIDITQVPGSGPGGRISTDDVKAFAKRLNTGAVARGAGAGVAQPPLPNFAKWGSVERKPMNNIRRKTAEHLSHSWNAIPHVTQFDKTDITELERLRKKISTKDKKVTITPFIMKVMASALKTFPQFNTSVDMGTSEVVYKKYYHIGVAVDTDRGLIVPVVRDVDKKSILQLADELNEIAEKARNKKTSLEEMQGGCFTLTNLGGIGGTSFTPIVNWPEVAILGVSRAQWEPTYIDNQFIPRLMLPLSLSYDHRVIDGADGARFLRWICDAIQQPFLMELERS